MAMHWLVVMATQGSLMYMERSPTLSYIVENINAGYNQMVSETIALQLADSCPPPTLPTLALDHVAMEEGALSDESYFPLHHVEK